MRVADNIPFYKGPFQNTIIGTVLGGVIGLLTTTAAHQTVYDVVAEKNFDSGRNLGIVLAIDAEKVSKIEEENNPINNQLLVTILSTEETPRQILSKDTSQQVLSEEEELVKKLSGNASKLYLKPNHNSFWLSLVISSLFPIITGTGAGAGFLIDNKNPPKKKNYQKLNFEINDIKD